jgi:hypothetical protein
MLFGSRTASQQTQQNANVIPNGSVNEGNTGDNNEQSPMPSATTQLLQPNTNSESPESVGLYSSSDHDYSRIVHSDSKVILDTGYFSWMKIVFSLT